MFDTFPFLKAICKTPVDIKAVRRIRKKCKVILPPFNFQSSSENQMETPLMNTDCNPEATPAKSAKESDT